MIAGQGLLLLLLLARHAPAMKVRGATAQAELASSNQGVEGPLLLPQMMLQQSPPPKHGKPLLLPQMLERRDDAAANDVPGALDGNISNSSEGVAAGAGRSGNSTVEATGLPRDIAAVAGLSQNVSEQHLRRSLPGVGLPKTEARPTSPAPAQQQNASDGQSSAGSDHLLSKSTDVSSLSSVDLWMPKESQEFLGLPTLFWALVADILAMLTFIGCIPVVLAMAKGMRPISCC
mmetsp:Transcript_71494/g.155293  ORF Transcript_71494/g.155293 Transcript_71494/m.155293 type:complete len:233 (+) Transcript_71494:137-835(+)